MLTDLYDTIRKVTPAPIWSAGVKLARREAVIGESFDDEEIELKVATGRGVLTLAVALYPLDDEWSCDCGARGPVCEHVVASVIAVRRAREAGLDLPAPSSTVGQLRYALGREERALTFERLVVVGDQTSPLEVSLIEAAAGQVPAPELAIKPHDLDVEEVLGSRLRGRVARERMGELLKVLAGCSDVRLDGVAVRPTSRPVMPWATVDTSDDGYLVQLHPDPTIVEVFVNGAALCADGLLRPIGEPGLPRDLIRELSRGRVYGPRQVPDLVTRLLPELKRCLRVEVRSGRLPGVSSDPPRVRVHSRADGQGRLVVEADLVYGDPVVARVVGEHLEVTGAEVPLRDEDEERALLERLRRDLGLRPGQPAVLDGEEAVRFSSRLMTWGGDLRGGAHEGFRLAPPITADVSVDGDRLNVSFASPAGSAQAGSVFGAWQRGSSLAPLDDGQGWAPLPVDFLREHGRLVADLLEARQEDGTLPRCVTPDLARLCEALGAPAPPSFAGLEALVADFEGIPEAELPSDLTATLRGYQLAGVAWLSFLREAGLGALLADDMGLGKTLQALTVLRGRTLVVAPTSVLRNWESEATRFRPSLRICVYHGPRREMNPEADLVLTTYAILRLDVDALAAERWHTAVLDEAQAIKNPESKVTRAAWRLQADFKITLTGTPVENRLDELWSQFQFINPGLLGSRDAFVERYARPIGEGMAGVAARLRERIRPFLLRRLKRDVAPELPPRTDVVLHVTLDDEERAAYDAVRAATRKDVADRIGHGGNALAALAALMRLRQAACHRGLLPGQDASRSSKIETLLEVLDEAVSEGHKALVFSQWTSLLDLVEPRLRDVGIPFVRLDGSTRDRQAVVDTFQDEDGPPVMLVSLKAGGTGLNLTQADHVFLLDPWWNPAVEDQAADRAHRIGQERPVMVHRLVAEDTVEERILALQESKRSLAGAALGEADRAASITRDELLSLLS